MPAQHMLLQIDHLIILPELDRKLQIWSPEKIVTHEKELECSMKSMGLLNSCMAVRVQQLADPNRDRFLFLEGFRRLNVARKMGWTELHCLVVDRRGLVPYQEVADFVRRRDEREKLDKHYSYLFK